MTDSPDSDDSIPSLCSYPPAFVSLITTFIKRAEEAETRAHKSLVILRAKDEQLFQLQQRMEVLEKVACRLEEVVPPLNLPRSPNRFEEIENPHIRDEINKRYINDHPPIQTLYERSNNFLHNEESMMNKDAHNCYEKCQNLIDGLERSNCHLRQALAKESQQRVKDHEQYVATLDKFTQAFKNLENKHPEGQTFLLNQTNSSNKPQFISKAAGDSIKNAKDFESCERKMGTTLADKYNFKEKNSLVESIVSVLQSIPEKRNSIRSNTLKAKKGEKAVYKILSKRSSSSFHSPKSSGNSRLNQVQISSHCFLNVLKKQNKKLKNKYHNLCEKYTENLTLCNRLKTQVMHEQSKNKNVSKVNQFTQTENVSLHPTLDYEKTQPCRSVNILQGRLDAAAKVMAKQCKQIQDLQKQLAESFAQVESLKKRVVRAESTGAAKEVLGEANKKQIQDLEKRNLALSQEAQEAKNLCSRLRQELAIQTDVCNKIKKDKEDCESQFIKLKTSLETKLQTLSTALQEKEHLSNQVKDDLENKLSGLREQFISQVTEASDRLVAADFKIQELYLGIETFLKLLFSVNSPELSPSSQAQALQVASDILQLPTIEVQTILHSSRCDVRAGKWIKECNQMVHEKVFAKTLGNLLLEAVLEARIA